MMLLDRDPSAEVLTAADVPGALELVGREGETADLLILDLTLPGVKGTELMEEIVRRQPTLKILVLSGLTDRGRIMRVLQLGAAGFVPKSLDTDMLTNAIEFVLKGGVFIPSKLLAESQREGFFSETARSFAQFSSNAPKLTDRQRDVLMLLAKGSPIKRICLELNLSEGTVKTHVAAIYRHLRRKQPHRGPSRGPARRLQHRNLSPFGRSSTDRLTSRPHGDCRHGQEIPESRVLESRRGNRLHTKS